jgi:hypothetical protein
MRYLIAIAGLICPVLANAQVRASSAVPSGVGDSIRAVRWNGARLEGGIHTTENWEPIWQAYAARRPPTTS